MARCLAARLEVVLDHRAAAITERCGLNPSYHACRDSGGTTLRYSATADAALRRSAGDYVAEGSIATEDVPVGFLPEPGWSEKRHAARMPARGVYCSNKAFCCSAAKNLANGRDGSVSI